MLSGNTIHRFESGHLSARSEAPHASIMLRPTIGIYMYRPPGLQADLHRTDHWNQSDKKPKPADRKVWKIASSMDHNP